MDTRASGCRHCEVEAPNDEGAQVRGKCLVLDNVGASEAGARHVGP
jgi:hypothetical protein